MCARASNVTRRFLFTWSRCLFLAALISFLAAPAWAARKTAEGTWYKGTTHSHSFWSDGDAFPEMVVDWIKGHGYDFFALSDHNSINQGERWRKMGEGRRAVTQELLDACVKRFGPDWLEIRGEGKEREVRLKTYEQIKAKFEEPGKFLLIRGEEITTRCSGKKDKQGEIVKKGKAVHLNALNLEHLIKPKRKPTVIGTIGANVQAAETQAKRIKQPILTHINHPNYGGYSITARDLAEVAEVQFVEMCNNHDGVKHYGDKKHPSVERLWDIANTIRLIEKKIAPIYGVATDDSHSYHTKSPKAAIPGRGYVVVRAEKLETAALFEAMRKGDFYASTGVELSRLDYDPETRTLHVRVLPKQDTHYTIEFIGSPADLKLPKDKAMNKTAAIGKVLAKHEGTAASHRLKDNDLYVRAAIRSDRRMAHPNRTGVQNEEAWTQPVGWEKFVGKE
jgi:histidinol phosphatase-like PHP family hydrolase